MHGLRISAVRREPLQARVEEIVRTERTSMVKVNVYSGTSVARAMIVVRGLWLIVKARGDEFWDVQPERVCGRDEDADRRICKKSGG